MSATPGPASAVPVRTPQASSTANGKLCPAPFLYLFFSAICWLIAAALLGFLASIKFHAPGFLANEPYWTYGRLHAAQNASLLYGFGMPAALGVGLWLLCRLGRVSLAGPTIVFLGTFVWNFAVTLGVAAIFWGDSTGYETFEIPGYCVPLLAVGYLMSGLCGLLTFHQREDALLYPSQWFVLGSLFWFPWIFSTASLLLLHWPARGALQALIAWWYAHNLSAVFLGFAGLAPAFYFVPKLLGRPLYSYQYAAMSFWTLALFGSWGGIPNGAPLPSWIISLGVVGTVLTAIPLLSIAANFCQTARLDINRLDTIPALRFFYISLTFWFIAGAQQIVGVLPHVSAITDLTWFGVAQKELFHYGFFAFSFFGAAYYIIPRLVNLDDTAWCPRLLKAHLYLTLFGVLITYLSLLVCGVGQGILLADARHTFPEVMRGSMLPLRVSTLGDLLLLVGTVLFGLNFLQLMTQVCRQCWAASGLPGQRRTHE
jgi:cytochrome c oxidase cbb3-type subunit 1